MGARTSTLGLFAGAVCACSSDDGVNRHDPSLIPGTWIVPAGVSMQQSSVQSITYSANQTYVTSPPSGQGQWNVRDGNFLDMLCTPSPGIITPYCKNITVNFEVSSTELVWQWAGNTEWRFDRAK